jgi:putative transposase
MGQMLPFIDIYLLFPNNRRGHLSPVAGFCRVVYTEGLSIAGERLHKTIAYDEDFLMTTRPGTTKGKARIQPGQGIKVNYLYYWSDAFRNPTVEKTELMLMLTDVR